MNAPNAALAGFAHELKKLAAPHHHGHTPSGADVVAAESLGPVASVVKGFREGRKSGGFQHGLAEAGKAGAGYVGGAALGATGGLLAAHAIKRLTGHDPGFGMVRASTVLPALGGTLAGLKAEQFLKHH